MLQKFGGRKWELNGLDIGIENSFLPEIANMYGRHAA
jgi:hypothetical protein